MNETTSATQTNDKPRYSIFDLLRELKAARQEVDTNGPEYREFADRLGKNSPFSADNILLIYRQAPTATSCASYRNWKEAGRQVKRGEHGIKIFAPIGTHRDGDTIGRGSAGPDAKLVTRFKIGYIFDLAQTEPAERRDAR